MPVVTKKEAVAISLTSEMRRKALEKSINVLSLLLTLFVKNVAKAAEPVSSMLAGHFKLGKSPTGWRESRKDLH